jgi:hypothetical protein
LRLDGYTTSMTVAASALPAFGPEGFTVEAWVALDTYPWNWVPIAGQQIAREAGFFFGIDALGHVGLEASFNGQWRWAVGKATIPLKRWAHLAGTYRAVLSPPGSHFRLFRRTASLPISTTMRKATFNSSAGTIGRWPKSPRAIAPA